jgi:hypothetical protein
VSVSHVSELGRTRLLTRRERRRRLGAIAVAVAGAILSAWVSAALVSLVSGDGLTFPRLGSQSLMAGADTGTGLLSLPTGNDPDPQPRHVQFPVTLGWPGSPFWSAVVAVPMWLGWLRLIARPMVAGLRQEARHQGLASVRTIRRHLGRAQARKAGRVTWPTTRGGKFHRDMCPRGDLHINHTPPAAKLTGVVVGFDHRRHPQWGGDQ